MALTPRLRHEMALPRGHWGAAPRSPPLNQATTRAHSWLRGVDAVVSGADRRLAVDAVEK